MDLVDEMFSVFRVKPKIISKHLYSIAVAKLYVNGFVSLSELLEYMDFSEAYSALYWIAKRLFPYIGIAINNPDVGGGRRGEIVLFTSINAASKHVCRELASSGGVELLESIAEEIEDALSSRPLVKEKALNTIRVLTEACKRTTSEHTRRGRGVEAGG